MNPVVHHSRRLHKQQTTMDKRAILDERRKKWMQDRETSLTVMETKREMSSSFGSSNIGGGQSKGREPQEIVPPGYTDIFLNKLTDKLASHIREEVRKEIQNSNEFSGEDLAEKMDTYLQDELSTHTCKICFELMESEKGKTPILLFPCGHTFCERYISYMISSTLSPFSFPLTYLDHVPIGTFDFKAHFLASIVHHSLYPSHHIVFHLFVVVSILMHKRNPNGHHHQQQTTCVVVYPV